MSHSEKEILLQIVMLLSSLRFLLACLYIVKTPNPLGSAFVALVVSASIVLLSYVLYIHFFY